MSRHVYPVEGRYLNGVPHVEHDCEDEFCVDSGAFTTDPPPKEAAPPKTKTRPSAGSSVSEE